MVRSRVEGNLRARGSVPRGRGAGRTSGRASRSPTPSECTVVGIDLAGAERRDTGFCVLDAAGAASARVLHTDRELLEAIDLVQPAVVSIDAPLFLPLGRPTIESRGPPHLRASDRLLLRMGIRFFPITLGPMRMLTARGMSLSAKVAARGIHRIEGYPGADQDVLGIPRKGDSLPGLRRGLRGLGITGDVDRADLGHDELDAITCAWIGRCFLLGDFLAIGDPSEGWMILPSREASLRRLSAGAGRSPSRPRR